MSFRPHKFELNYYKRLLNEKGEKLFEKEEEVKEFFNIKQALHMEKYVGRAIEVFDFQFIENIFLLQDKKQAKIIQRKKINVAEVLELLLQHLEDTSLKKYIEELVVEIFKTINYQLNQLMDKEPKKFYKRESIVDWLWRLIDLELRGYIMYREKYEPNIKVRTKDKDKVEILFPVEKSKTILLTAIFFISKVDTKEKKIDDIIRDKKLRRAYNIGSSLENRVYEFLFIENPNDKVLELVDAEIKNKNPRILITQLVDFLGYYVPSKKSIFLVFPLIESTAKTLGIKAYKFMDFVFFHELAHCYQHYLKIIDETDNLDILNPIDFLKLSFIESSANGYALYDLIRSTYNYYRPSFASKLEYFIDYYQPAEYKFYRSFAKQSSAQTFLKACSAASKNYLLGKAVILLTKGDLIKTIRELRIDEAKRKEDIDSLEKLKRRVLFAERIMKTLNRHSNLMEFNPWAQELTPSEIIREIELWNSMGMNRFGDHLRFIRKHDPERYYSVNIKTTTSISRAFLEEIKYNNILTKEEEDSIKINTLNYLLEGTMMFKSTMLTAFIQDMINLYEEAASTNIPIEEIEQKLNMFRTIYLNKAKKMFCEKIIKYSLFKTKTKDLFFIEREPRPKIDKDGRRIVRL